MQNRAPQSPADEPRYLAVIYAFAVTVGDERRMVTEERVPASTVAMLQPQLHASARRSRVAQGPGLLIFDNYRDALQSAQAIATIATTVAVREVTPTADPRAEGWADEHGVRYAALSGGLVRTIKA